MPFASWHSSCMARKFFKRLDIRGCEPVISSAMTLTLQLLSLVGCALHTPSLSRIVSEAGMEEAYIGSTVSEPGWVVDKKSKEVIYRQCLASPDPHESPRIDIKKGSQIRFNLDSSSIRDARIAAEISRVKNITSNNLIVKEEPKANLRKISEECSRELSRYAPAYDNLFFVQAVMVADVSYNLVGSGEIEILGFSGIAVEAASQASEEFQSRNTLIIGYRYLSVKEIIQSLPLHLHGDTPVVIGTKKEYFVPPKPPSITQHKKGRLRWFVNPDLGWVHYRRLSETRFGIMTGASGGITYARYLSNSRNVLGYAIATSTGLWLGLGGGSGSMFSLDTISGLSWKYFGLGVGPSVFRSQYESDLLQLDSSYGLGPQADMRLGPGDLYLRLGGGVAWLSNPERRVEYTIVDARHFSGELKWSASVGTRFRLFVAEPPYDKWGIEIGYGSLLVPDGAILTIGRRMF